MIPCLRLALCLIILSGAGAGLALAGPLAQSSRLPLMFMVMTPEAERPDLPENRLALDLDADYTSVFVNKSSERWRVLIDMEIATVTPGFELRLGNRMSLGWRLPLVSMNDGFLDGPLNDYHEAGSFPDYGRLHRPENVFAYVVEKDGRAWFSPDKGGLHPADSRLNLKYRVHSGPDWAAALMYSLKLPTGDEKKGLGSGNIDQGLFLLSRLTSGALTWTLNPGLIVPRDPDTLGATIKFRTMACLFVGAEYHANDDVSLTVQLNTFTSPLSDTGIDTLDRPCVELGLGLVCRLAPGLTLDASFNEDLSGPSPDFTVRTGIRYDLPW